MRPLPRAFYDRDTVTVARDLQGKYLAYITDNPFVSRRQNELAPARISDYHCMRSQVARSCGGGATP